MSGKRSVACFMHALLLPSCLSVIPTAAAVLSGFFRGRKGFSSLRWATKICLRNMAGTNFWSLLLPVGNPPWRQGGGRRVAYVLPLPLLSRVLSTVLFKTKWGEISPSPHSLFPSGRVFSAKKCAKKEMGREKRAVAVVKKCSQSFSLSLSLSRSLCKYSKNGLFRMFVHGKREKKYKDVVFGRMAEYTFQGFFPSKGTKNLPCCSFSHISWAVFVYSQKEKNPPSMLCRVGGNRLFASPSPSPKLSLANIFCGPPSY